MAQGKTFEPFRQVRIDTWKSIARYLGRSSRTVQRWHREYGLPVHHLGVDTGSIFAFADELDSWLRNSDRTPKNTLLEMPRPTAPHNASVQRQFDRDRGTVNLPQILGSRRANSGALVAFANKLWESLSNQNLKLLAKCFREAVDLDPGNAEAFAGLSFALIAEGVLGNLRVPGAYLSAKAALGHAMEIDPELPEALCAKAWLKMLLDRDWRGAHRAYEVCLSLRPSDTRAAVGRALLHIAEGASKDASGLLQCVVQQSALNASAAALYCWSEYLAEDYEVAYNLIEEIRTSGQFGPILDVIEALICIRCEKPEVYIPHIESLVADSPRHELLRGVLGYAFTQNGEFEKANEILQAISHPAAGERCADAYAVGLILTGLNEKHDAVQWLEQSYRSGSLWSLAFLSDPALKSLRDEPSYRMFLSNITYPVQTKRIRTNEDSATVFFEKLHVSTA